MFKKLVLAVFMLFAVTPCNAQTDDQQLFLASEGGIAFALGAVISLVNHNLGTPVELAFSTFTGLLLSKKIGNRADKQNFSMMRWVLGGSLSVKLLHSDFRILTITPVLFNLLLDIREKYQPLL